MPKPASATPSRADAMESESRCRVCGHTAEGRHVGLLRKRIACATQLDDGIGQVASCWCPEMIHAATIVPWHARPIVDAD